MVVLTESFRENLIGRGVPDEKVSVVTNGVNRGEWSCSDLAEREAARTRLGVSNRFVLGYAGTLGHVRDRFSNFGIIGAAAGSLFVFKDKYRAVLISYPSAEEHERLLPANMA